MHVAPARSGIWLRHRRAARPKGLDRAPGPSGAHAPAARASSLLGDFARRDPDCDRVGEARGPSALTLSAAGRATTCRDRLYLPRPLVPTFPAPLRTATPPA